MLPGWTATASIGVGGMGGVVYDFFILNIAYLMFY
jgi:hypothetical protein